MCNRAFWAAALLVMGCLAGFAAEAGDHGERHRHREGHHERELEDAVPAPDNALYIATCGACHMVYPPGLLNAASWSALLRGSGDHFGEMLGLEDTDAALLDTYLRSQAAEATQGELAGDIARDLGARVVSRITEIPEIRKEHRKLPAAVVARKSIGRLSNCIACHRRADGGVFDDDSVSIPSE
ncbi:MAG: hypothetical protein AB7E47_03885 [Desulfovibrionaceae bacterium]